MTTTEAVPYCRNATNRITDVYEKLEQSKPLAVRLDKDSTVGMSQFSDEPRSTWGFNPFASPRKPTGEKLSSGSYCSHLVVHFIESKCLDILTAIKDVREPVCSKIRWHQLPKAGLTWQMGSGRSDVSGLCAFSDLVNWINLFTSRCVADAPQVVGQAETAPVGSTPVHRLEPVEVDLSDYFDTPSLEWDESDYKAAESARNFSEELYADH